MTRSDRRRGRGKDPDEQSKSPIYGVVTIDPDTIRGHPSITLANNPEAWRKIFDQAVQFVTKFLAVHDPFEIVARTSCQVLFTLGTKQEYISQGNVKAAVNLSPSELEHDPKSLNQKEVFTHAGL
jgi:hypothetical protein